MPISSKNEPRSLPDDNTFLDPPRVKASTEPPVFHVGIPNPMFEGLINLYVIAGDPLTVIDTGIGTPEALIALEQGLHAHGLTIDEIGQNCPNDAGS